MTSNRVHILNNGVWNAPGPVIYRHPSGRVEPVAIAMNFFLMEAGKQRILVDTGMDDLDRFISDDLRDELGLGEIGSTKAELSRIGLEPEDIDIVLLTHLHFDHVDNIAEFPNARVILNEIEWRFVTTPRSGSIVSREAFPRATARLSHRRGLGAARAHRWRKGDRTRSQGHLDRRTHARPSDRDRRHERRPGRSGR